MGGTKSLPGALEGDSGPGGGAERVSVSRRWSRALVLCHQNHSGFKWDSTNSRQLRFVGETSKMVGGRF